TAEGDRLVMQAQNEWKAMASRAEDNQWWGNAATVVFALAVSLVPGGGWLVGGAIFTTMAFDRVVTEINLDGHASGEAWAMLALTIGTMGLGGAAAITREVALAAEATQASNASRLLLASRVLTLSTLGVGLGFAAYTGVEAYHAFSEGRTRDGVLMTGMALFPFAHMTGARAWRVYEARGRSAAATDIASVLDEVGPSQSRPQVDIPSTETAQSRRGAQLRNPAELLRFVEEFIGRDAAGRRALLESIPEGMRASISRLAEHPVVRRALQADGGGLNNELVRTLLNREITKFEGPRPEAGG